MSTAPRRPPSAASAYDDDVADRAEMLDRIVNQMRKDLRTIAADVIREEFPRLRAEIVAELRAELAADRGRRTPADVAAITAARRITPGDIADDGPPLMPVVPAPDGYDARGSLLHRLLRAAGPARWALIGSVAVVLMLMSFGAWYVVGRDKPTRAQSTGSVAVAPVTPPARPTVAEDSLRAAPAWFDAVLRDATHPQSVRALLTEAKASPAIGELAGVWEKSTLDAQELGRLHDAIVQAALKTQTPGSPIVVDGVITTQPCANSCQALQASWKQLVTAPHAGTLADRPPPADWSAFEALVVRRRLDR